MQLISTSTNRNHAAGDVACRHSVLQQLGANVSDCFGVLAQRYVFADDLLTVERRREAITTEISQLKSECDMVFLSAHKVVSRWSGLYEEGVPVMWGSGCTPRQ